MPTTRYNALQTLIRAFAPTRLGAWLFARSAHVLDRLYVKTSHSHKTLAAIVAGLPVMLMTTRGAKSGLPRTTPLVYVSDTLDPKRLAVIATNFGQHHFPGWYYNLKAYPQASCAVDGITYPCLVHEASGEEYERLWHAFIRTFSGYSAYKRRAGRRVPIMVLTPLGEQPSEASFQQSETTRPG